MNPTVHIVVAGFHKYSEATRWIYLIWIFKIYDAEFCLEYTAEST
jgi:hypothetical protein